MKIDFMGSQINELEDYITARGEKKFRAKQIFQGFHKNLKMSIKDISTLGSELKKTLLSDDGTPYMEIVNVLRSKKDQTQKFLFKLHDGQIIEAVYMEYDNRCTVCISTQVGCRMGCSFCASTQSGLVRHLSCSEMLQQVYLISNHRGKRINNIVLMGIGEPLDNYEETIKFLHMISDEQGYHLSLRHITLSTSGLASKIKKLALEKLPINLTVSLHNPFDEERAIIMPISKSNPISEVLKACDFYFEKTGRRVSFEYTVIDGVNNSLRHAEALNKLFFGKNVHINLIPLNPIKECDFKSPKNSEIHNFYRLLLKLGLNATIRMKMGEDINGACGQLRRDYESNRGVF